MKIRWMVWHPKKPIAYMADDETRAWFHARVQWGMTNDQLIAAGWKARSFEYED